MEPTDFLDRMVIERDDLSDKIEKLDDFMAHGDVYPTLPAVDRNLLIAQHDAMVTYRTILCSRISLVLERQQ